MENNKDHKGNKPNKTYRITKAYIGNVRIEAFTSGKEDLNIIVNDYNVEGASVVLNALGYRLTKRQY